MIRQLITTTLVVISVVAMNDIATAQSGSRRGASAGVRSGGSSGVRIGASSRGVGGGRSSFRGAGSSTRLSAQEKAENQRQQAIVQQQQFRENELRQAESAKANFKDTLVRLGQKSNASINRRQNKLAFDEAKRDFNDLKRGTVSPSQVGVLSEPFRLDHDSIDRMKNSANWPEVFKSPDFEPFVMELDDQIMNGGVDDAESAEKFLNQLSELNYALNSAAVNGDVASVDYARARRFVSGLANEIRASDLLM